MLVHGISRLALRTHPGPLGPFAAFRMFLSSGSRGGTNVWGLKTLDPNDTGYGYGPEQLAEFQVPEAGVLLDYAAAALRSAKDYLGERSDRDFDDIPVVNPRGGTMTLANMCQQLLWEFNQHGGQIAYLRGLQRGLEDARYSGGLLEGWPPGRAGMADRQLLLLVQMTVEPEHLEAFTTWYNSHLPNLLRIPGYQWAQRYVDLDGGTRFTALYGIRSADDLPSLLQFGGPELHPIAASEFSVFSTLQGISGHVSNVYEQVSGSPLRDPLLLSDRPLSIVTSDVDPEHEAGGTAGIQSPTFPGF